MTDTAITLPRKLLQDAINSLEGYRRELRDTQPCDTEKELKAALAAPPKEAIGIWNGGRVPEPQPVKQAPPYCGSSHCSCIECVMEKKP